MIICTVMTIRRIETKRSLHCMHPRHGGESTFVSGLLWLDEHYHYHRMKPAKTSE